jgi:hypothetical protein
MMLFSQAIKSSSPSSPFSFSLLTSSILHQFDQYLPRLEALISHSWSSTLKQAAQCSQDLFGLFIELVEFRARFEISTNGKVTISENVCSL